MLVGSFVGREARVGVLGEEALVVVDDVVEDLLELAETSEEGFVGGHEIAGSLGELEDGLDVEVGSRRWGRRGRSR